MELFDQCVPQKNHRHHPIKRKTSIRTSIGNLFASHRHVQQTTRLRRGLRLRSGDSGNQDGEGGWWSSKHGLFVCHACSSGPNLPQLWTCLPAIVPVCDGSKFIVQTHSHESAPPFRPGSINDGGTHQNHAATRGNETNPHVQIFLPLPVRKQLQTSKALARRVQH